MSADRARDFLARIEASNVGAETLDQLIDDVRRLVTASQHQPLPTLLGDLVDTQDRAFELLERRQRPEQTRDLYLIAGIACGLMAKASHDLGAPHDAMTHARTGYACADNAGHDGLRAGRDRAFGDESGTRSALAVARVFLREIDGAAEALAPVLELPPQKRIHGIVTSVEHVRTALSAVEDPGRDAAELAGAIEGFTSERLALQR